MHKAINRFELLADNPDLKPKDVQEINIPEDVNTQQDDSKVQQWQQFSQSLAGLDPKAGLIKNFHNFIKMAGRVGLPQGADANNYSICFIGSNNEMKVYEKKNITHTDLSFPFSCLSPNIQKRLLEWNTTEDELQECLEAVVPKLELIYIENKKRDLGMALHLKIFVQLIANQKPELYTNFLIKHIARMEPNAASRNTKFLNYIVWELAQASKNSEKYTDLMVLVSAYFQAVLDTILNKKKLDDKTIISWCYNYVLITNFVSKVIQKHDNKDLVKVYQATLIDALYSLDRIKKVKVVNSFAKQIMNEAFSRAIDHMKTSDTLLAYETLVQGAQNYDLDVLPDFIQQFLTQNIQCVKMLHEDILQLLGRPEFSFLASHSDVAKLLKQKPIKQKQATRPAVIDQNYLEDMEKHIISPISCCSMVWIATFVYLAVVATAFDGQQYDMVIQFAKKLIEQLKPICSFVTKLFVQLEKAYQPKK